MPYPFRIMTLVLPILLSLMITATVAFNSSSSNNNNNNNIVKSKLTGNAQIQLSSLSRQQRSRSRSKSSSSNCRSSSSSALHLFSPRDITRAAIVLSYVASDADKFFPNVKISKLRMSYAQVFGQLTLIGSSILLYQQQQIHLEEMAVELFLLSFSMKPVIRSIRLFRYISTSNCSNDEECVLEFDELETETAPPIDNNDDYSLLDR